MCGPVAVIATVIAAYGRTIPTFGLTVRAATIGAFAPAAA
jgi:hypothetical protein